MGNVKIAANQLHRGLALRTVSEAEPVGASVELIRTVFKQHGYDFEKNEVMAICRYLEGKGLINISNSNNSVLGISRFISTITPKGIDVLEGTVQVEGIELEG